jgi:MFS family permease
MEKNVDKLIVGKANDGSLTKSNFGARGWLIIVICMLMCMVQSVFSVDGQNIYVSVMAANLKVTPNLLLAFATPIGWITCITGFLSGQLVMKKGPRKVAFVFSFVCAIAVAVFGNSKSPVLYFISLLCVLVCTNCLSASVHYAYVGTWFPKRKGLVMGYTTMGLPATSLILVPLMALATAPGGIGFTAFCYFLSAALVIIAFVCFFLTRDTPEELGKYPDNIKPEHDVAKGIDILSHFKSSLSVRCLLKEPATWQIAVGFATPALAVVGIMSQIVPRLMETGKFATVAMAVSVLSVSTIPGLAGSYFWGWVDAKIGTKKAGMLLNAWFIFALILLIFLDQYPVFLCYVVVSVAMFGSGGAPNLMPSMMISCFGRFEFLSAQRVIQPMSGVIVSCTFLLLAATRSIGGWTFSFGIYIAACLIGIIIMSRIDTRNRFDDSAIEAALIAAAKKSA